MQLRARIKHARLGSVVVEIPHGLSAGYNPSKLTRDPNVVGVPYKQAQHRNNAHEIAVSEGVVCELLVLQQSEQLLILCVRSSGVCVCVLPELNQ